MKRFILMLTLCFSLTSIRSFATDNNISDAALSAFKTSFAQATDVSWSTFNEYYKVSFVLEGEYVTAYYDREGQRIALKRNITAKQLPLALQVSLKNEYSGYWISDMVEITNEVGMSYYATIENADARIVLKSGSSSDWTTFSKSKK